MATLLLLALLLCGRPVLHSVGGSGGWPRPLLLRGGQQEWLGFGPRKPSPWKAHGLQQSDSSCSQIELSPEQYERWTTKGDWPSDFSSDNVDPETGLKGECEPGSFIPRRLDEMSSEIDELTRPDPAKHPDADEHRAGNAREQRGVLDPSFKASTLLDESWDEEHEHLHPDRLVMREDMPERLVQIMREKPVLRSLPEKLFDKRACIKESEDAAYNRSWHECLATLSAVKAREDKRKQAGHYSAYIDLDDVDLAVDEEVYQYYENLSPDHPDFEKGPLSRSRARGYACMHACMHAYARTHACMHVCMHTCMYARRGPCSK